MMPGGLITFWEPGYGGFDFHSQVLRTEARMYRPSYAVLFLIIVGAANARFPTWAAALVVLAYIGLDFLDYRAKRMAIESVIEYETTGWKPDPDKTGWKADAEYEIRGNLSRRKLTGNDQIMSPESGKCCGGCRDEEETLANRD
jgi:hypothetical protein